MVPLDRPGPGQQLIYNWLFRKNWSLPFPMSLDPQPIRPEYQNPKPDGGIVYLVKSKFHFSFNT